jgi:deazaflavin-dependent oxidoreductase (nitroreductase family)
MVPSTVHRDRGSAVEEAEMTKTYRLSPATRLANVVFGALTRRGRGAGYRYILTVEGRRSGVARSTPVDVMDVDGQRWLVAPYGDVNWVRNARAAGEVELSRGGRSTRWTAVEVRGRDAVPAIRQYILSVPVTAAYWEVDADSPEEAVAAASEQHPAFRLTPLLPEPV